MDYYIQVCMYSSGADKYFAIKYTSMCFSIRQLCMHDIKWSTHAQLHTPRNSRTVTWNNIQIAFV